MITKKLVIALIPAYLVIALLLGFLINQKLQTANKVEVLSTIENVEFPDIIRIPDLEIEVDVTSGNYSEVEKNWNVSDSYAQIATISSFPNKVGGNTVIYGHNTNSIFGKTSKIRPGQKAYIETKNGNIFVYEFISEKTVQPSDTSVFEYEGDPILTLITCTGFANEKRRILTFKLIEVEKI